MILVKIGLSKEKTCTGKIYFWTIMDHLCFFCFGKWVQRCSKPEVHQWLMNRGSRIVQQIETISIRDRLLPWTQQSWKDPWNTKKPGRSCFCCGWLVNPVHQLIYQQGCRTERRRTLKMEVRQTTSFPTALARIFSAIPIQSISVDCWP